MNPLAHACSSWLVVEVRVTGSTELPVPVRCAVFSHSSLLSSPVWRPWLGLLSSLSHPTTTILYPPSHHRLDFFSLSPFTILAVSTPFSSRSLFPFTHCLLPTVTSATPSLNLAFPFPPAFSTLIASNLLSISWTDSLTFQPARSFRTSLWQPRHQYYYSSYQSPPKKRLATYNPHNCSVHSDSKASPERSLPRNILHSTSTFIVIPPFRSSRILHRLCTINFLLSGSIHCRYQITPVYISL